MSYDFAVITVFSVSALQAYTRRYRIEIIEVYNLTMKVFHNQSTILYTSYTTRPVLYAHTLFQVCPFVISSLVDVMICLYFFY